MRTLAARVKHLKVPPATLMEVCGTHTVAIARYGLRQALPEGVRLISGPGCPVCVTPQAQIDRFLALGRMPNAVLATFGDMLRVPGFRIHVGASPRRPARKCSSPIPPWTRSPPPNAIPIAK